MEKSFRTAEIARFLETTERTVRFYVEEGLWKPELGETRRGKVRRYTRRDVLGLLLVRRMAELGLRIEKIRELVEILRSQTWFVFEDEQNLRQRDLDDPQKEWIDFVELTALEEEGIRLYIKLVDVESDNPMIFIEPVPYRANKSILRMSEMEEVESIVIINVTNLFEKAMSL